MGSNKNDNLFTDIMIVDQNIAINDTGENVYLHVHNIIVVDSETTIVRYPTYNLYDNGHNLYDNDRSCCMHSTTCTPPLIDFTSTSGVTKYTSSIRNVS